MAISMQIGGMIAALCVVMFAVALVVDELFTFNLGFLGDWICGWKGTRSAIGWKESTTDYPNDDLKNETAGKVWLAFGIMTIFMGFAGSVLALVPSLKHLKIIAMTCVAVAGLFGIIGASGAFVSDMHDGENEGCASFISRSKFFNEVG